jgi:S1-C subfamily serine protease
MNRLIVALAALTAAVPAARGQETQKNKEKRDDSERDRSDRVWISRDEDRPRLGISTSSGSRRDTLGLLVSSVSRGSPAEKAGLEEGDRIAAINGVNLRLSRDDAGMSDMEGVLQRRLVRELEKHKVGDEVELRVYSNGQQKTLKVKLESADDWEQPRVALRVLRDKMENRPVLGIDLSSNGSRRDTLGVLVIGVTEDGPAEKAGIVEGDRIAAINGVDLRVSKDDAGDWGMSNARVRRFRREMEKVKPGDDVEVRVYSGGQTKTLRVKVAKASDLSDDDRHGFSFGDGFMDGVPMAPMPMVTPRAPRAPRAAVTPYPPREPMMFHFDNDGDGPFRVEVDREWRDQLEVQLRRLRDGVREGALQLKRLAPRIRVEMNDTMGDVDDDADGVGDGDMDDDDVAMADARAYAGAAASTRPRIATAVGPRIRAVGEAGPALRVGRGISAFTGDNETVWLDGLRLARVDGELASYFGDGSNRGLLVLDVSDRWRGIREGDVILRLDGRAVREGSRGIRVQLTDGPSHRVELLRGGKRITVDATRDDR